MFCYIFLLIFSTFFSHTVRDGSKIRWMIKLQFIPIWSQSIESNQISWRFRANSKPVFANEIAPQHTRDFYRATQSCYQRQKTIRRNFYIFYTFHQNLAFLSNIPCLVTVNVLIIINYPSLIIINISKSKAAPFTECWEDK